MAKENYHQEPVARRRKMDQMSLHHYILFIAWKFQDMKILRHENFVIILILRFFLTKLHFAAF